MLYIEYNPKVPEFVVHAEYLSWAVDPSAIAHKLNIPYELAIWIQLAMRHGLRPDMLRKSLLRLGRRYRKRIK